MDQDEITRIIAALSHESWVKLVRYPGSKPGEVSVDCTDGKSWRLARPIHLVRLKYQYHRAV